MSIKDWWPSPTGKPPKRPIPIPPGPWHRRGSIKYKIIGNLGDVNPIDYGGFIVYVLRDRGKDYLQAEFWMEPEERAFGLRRYKYEVYSFNIEEDVMEDLDWVDDWEKIAEAHYVSLRQLQAWSISENPLVRAMVYRHVGNFYGWENLDFYPERLTRRELERRWPMYA